MTFVSVNKATGSVHDLSEVGIGSDHRLPFLQSDQGCNSIETLELSFGSRFLMDWVTCVNYHYHFFNICLV